MYSVPSFQSKPLILASFYVFEDYGEVLSRLDSVALSSCPMQGLPSEYLRQR